MKNVHLSVVAASSTHEAIRFEMVCGRRTPEPTGRVECTRRRRTAEGAGGMKALSLKAAREVGADPLHLCAGCLYDEEGHALCGGPTCDASRPETSKSVGRARRGKSVLIRPKVWPEKRRRSRLADFRVHNSTASKR